MLRLDGVSRAWEGFELSNINLEIERGEYFVLLGPSGAGKTLLLETLLGFHRIDKGRILLEGADIAGLPPESRGFGYLPQDCLLFPHMTVRKNVEFGLKMRGMEVSDMEIAVDKVLDLVGLRSLENRIPGTLSGGERQRVALARCIVLEPKVILLDEPLSNIDSETKKGLRDELRRIHRELHVTVLHVTHDQLEAFSLADKIAIMSNGRILQAGDSEDVFRNPREPFVARFLGYENVHVGRLVESNREFSLLDVDGLAFRVDKEIESRECSIAVWPEDVQIFTTPQVSDACNVLKGKVEDCLDLGSTVVVSMNTGIPFKAVLSKRSFLEEGLQIGQDVWLVFEASSVKILA